MIAVGDETGAAEPCATRCPRARILVGTDGLAEAATTADVVVNAVVGFAGLPVTLAALDAGKRLALANKESLIAAGPVVQKVAPTPGAEIDPRRLRALRRSPVPAGRAARPRSRSSC